MSLHSYLLRVWRNSSIRGKFRVISVLILVVALVNGAGILLFLQNQDRNAAIVNMAGKERYRTSQMASLTAQIAAGEDDHRDELRTVAARYNRTLTTMIHGDPSRDIPPATGPVRAQLLETRRHWQAYHENVQVVTSAPRDSPEFAAAAQYIHAESDTLLTASDTVVDRYQSQYEQDVTRFKQLQLLLIVTTVVALLVVRFITLRGVVSPLSKLATDARAVAAGDLDRPITTHRLDDEVGMLTEAIREMKAHLVASLKDVRGFKNAVEHAGHAVILTDSNGDIHYANSAFEQLTGYAEATVQGQQLCSLITEDDTTAEGIWTAVNIPEIWTGEDVWRHVDGFRYHVEQTVAPVVNDAGDLEQVVVVAREITESKLKEQQIQVQNRVLRHNLRNRTNVIGGHADSLLSVADSTLKPSTETLAEFVPELSTRRGTPAENLESVETATQELATGTARVRHHGKKIRAGADDLTSMSEKAARINKVYEEAAAQEATASLREVLEAECEEFTQQHPDASFTISVPDVEISALYATKTALHEVIANALEHNESSRPCVEITAVKSDDEKLLEISVRDNGPGMSEYERQVIETGEETPLSHGSGIGLWTINWLINSIGGTFSVTNNGSQGTVVTLSVPTVSADQDPIPMNHS